VRKSKIAVAQGAILDRKLWFYMLFGARPCDPHTPAHPACNRVMT
jgi:hypothetical protein